VLVASRIQQKNSLVSGSGAFGQRPTHPQSSAQDYFLDGVRACGKFSNRPSNSSPNVTFKQFIESMDIHEVLPRREYASKLVKMACEDGSPLQKLCLMTIFSIVGDDIGELDTVRTNRPRDHLHPVLFQTTFPRFVRFYPAGTSLKVVADVIQYYLSGGGHTPPESKVQNSFQASSRGATSAPPRPTGCTTTAARRPFSTCPKSPLPSRCTTDRAICW
jgi:hypothetical protein